MNISLNYVFYRLLFRLGDFFHHWYADASKVIFHWFLNFLEGLDRVLAFRITLRHIFEPLYKDYSFMGHILGFVFRSLRLAMGLIVYLFCGGVFLLAYLSWLLLPIALLSLSIKYFAQ